MKPSFHRKLDAAKSVVVACGVFTVRFSLITGLVTLIGSPPPPATSGEASEHTSEFIAEWDQNPGMQEAS